jgi:Wiskott-Aldrich syndrome protein
MASRFGQVKSIGSPRPSTLLGPRPRRRFSSMAATGGGGRVRGRRGERRPPVGGPRPRGKGAAPERGAEDPERGGAARIEGRFSLPSLRAVCTHRAIDNCDQQAPGPPSPIAPARVEAERPRGEHEEGTRFPGAELPPALPTDVLGSPPLTSSPSSRPCRAARCSASFPWPPRSVRRTPAALQARTPQMEGADPNAFRPPSYRQHDQHESNGAGAFAAHRLCPAPAPAEAGPRPPPTARRAPPRAEPPPPAPCPPPHPQTAPPPPPRPARDGQPQLAIPSKRADARPARRLKS